MSAGIPETSEPTMRDAVELIAAKNTEIDRLRTVIRAARAELEHGGGGEAEAYLILKHSGVGGPSE